MKTEIKHTIGNSPEAFHRPWSFSRKPAGGLRIFHQSEYMLRDYAYLVLEVSVMCD